uniref:Ovule protein n=1 Tax=Steinernema glaseri TaxID=37863 RepID=A0A1I7YQ56_9BILA
MEIVHTMKPLGTFLADRFLSPGLWFYRSYSRFCSEHIFSSLKKLVTWKRVSQSTLVKIKIIKIIPMKSKDTVKIHLRQRPCYLFNAVIGQRDDETPLEKRSSTLLQFSVTWVPL